jgi:hypothetical protein
MIYQKLSEQKYITFRLNSARFKIDYSLCLIKTNCFLFFVPGLCIPHPQFQKSWKAFWWNAWRTDLRDVLTWLDVLTCETFWLDLTWENLNVQVIQSSRQSFIHSIVFTFLSVFCSLILYCLTIADLFNDNKTWIDRPITSFSSHFNVNFKDVLNVNFISI